MVINFENIPIYGIFILLSLLINCIIIFFLGKVQGIKNNITLCSLTFEMIGIIAGAKILNMIQRGNFSSFYYAGFSSYGGVIGGIFALIIFSKLYKISLKKLLMMYIPILPLLYSISKLGCLFNGCCFGIEYSGGGSIVYEYAIDAPLNVRLLPIQFIESIINFIIFVYIMCIYKKYKDSVKIISLVFLLCGLSKFILEFFRASWPGSLSSTQIISIVFIILGIIIGFKWRRNEKE